MLIFFQTFIVNNPFFILSAHIGVKQIINSVVDELNKDPTRKFIQVEVAFLHHWWIDSPEPRRDLMRKLVKDKQLEFINGGWSMHDEATAYYEDIID